MKTFAQATVAWKEYARQPSLSSLKSAIWDNEQSPAVADDLRSVCWKSFLLFQDSLPLEPPVCLPILRDARSAYASLRGHFLKAIENPGYINESGSDPLGEDEQSLWNSLRADEIIREEIWRDVERCMPENDYFREPRVQKLLLDALFVWCKLNPDIGYRQGMHEILAPLVWVLDADSIDAKAVGVDESDVVAEMLDSRFIEHDAFTLFARVMQTAKSFYEQADKKLDDGEAPMILRSRHIMDELLQMVDPELASHLRNIDILPQIFLMRWIRLLFGREFPFTDVLEMWDLLFSEGSSLELVDYVCVTMLLKIRHELLQSDMNSALTLLLRYPHLGASMKPRTLVRDARAVLRAPSYDTGATLIMKYSGRHPAPLVDSQRRPSTPSSKTATPVRPPHGVSSSPAKLEALIQDAAKGVFITGERWGFNQALRDVVGEVKRGVERGIQNSPDPSTWSRSASPRGLHQRTRSTKSTSESHGFIAANVLRKMNGLEDRNRRLSIMLDSAVQELWKCHEQLAEKAKIADTVENEQGKLAEKLSQGVAEVQFVQAFLRDMTLPLPDSHDESHIDSDASLAAHRKASADQNETGHSSLDPRTPSNVQGKSRSINTPSLADGDNSIESSVAFEVSDSQVIKHVPSSETSQDRSAVSPALPISLPNRQKSGLLAKGLADPATMPPPIPHSNVLDPFLARPRLTSASFSWMLADNNAESQPFARATPFAPNEKRMNARNGKGFLFGDEEEDRHVTKDKLDKSPASRKVTKSKGKTTIPAAVREREDIGLGDVVAEQINLRKDVNS